MGILSRKRSKESKLSYKELYEIELNNRKLIENRYNELKKENIELQKGTGIADLRKVNEELVNSISKLEEEIAFLKEDRAKVYLQKEDAINELNMLKSKKKGVKKNGK